MKQTVNAAIEAEGRRLDEATGVDLHPSTPCRCDWYWVSYAGNRAALRWVDAGGELEITVFRSMGGPTVGRWIVSALRRNRALDVAGKLPAWQQCWWNEAKQIKYHHMPAYGTHIEAKRAVESMRYHYQPGDEDLLFPLPECTWR